MFKGSHFHLVQKWFLQEYKNPTEPHDLLNKDRVKIKKSMTQKPTYVVQSGKYVK